MRRDDDAVEEYEPAIRLAPSDPTAHLNMGYLHSERDRITEAKQSWHKVIVLAPHNPDAEDSRRNLADEIT